MQRGVVNKKSNISAISYYIDRCARGGFNVRRIVDLRFRIIEERFVGFLRDFGFDT